MTQDNIMGVLPVRSLLIRMSWPMMLSMLIQALYNLVDSIFVAHLCNEAFEALSLIYPLQTLMVAVCVGTGVGINSMLSRRLGEGRADRASAVAANGFLLYFITWLVFALSGMTFLQHYMNIFTSDAVTVRYGLDYLTIVTAGSIGMCWQFAGERVLQASGNAVGHLLIQGTGALINLILDPVLIFGLGPFPALEVKGAALATVLGQITGMILGLIMVRRSKAVTVRFKGFRPDREAICAIYRIGIPAIAMQALTTVMSLGMNKILGWISSTGVFILGAYFKLQSFIFMPVFGLSNGMVPPVSFNYGAKSRGRVTGLVRFALMIAGGIMVFGTVLLMAIPGQLLGLFDADGALLTDGIPALRIISLSFLFAGITIILCSYFQAISSPLLSLVISLLRQVVLLLPFAWLLGCSSPERVWWSFPIADSITCVIAVFACRKITQKKIRSLEA